MSSQRHLFIGGKQDGKWIATDGRTNWAVPIFEPEANYREPTWSGDVPRRRPIMRQNYIRHRFQGAEKKYVVYALQGITADGVFEALISNYNLMYLHSEE